MKRITVLGSTGSIGKNTLDVISHHPGKFEVIALTAKSKIDELFLQCQRFNPHFAVLERADHAKDLQDKIAMTPLKTQVLSGSKALEEVVALPEVDYVMAGIVGAAGLLPTLAAAKAGKRILLANKEALVMSGSLFMETVRASRAILLPVDSEHNAIFQCLPKDYIAGDTPLGVEKIILTASGGPLRTFPIELFPSVTPRQAITHPTWEMGAKISVDSATMMNKGLEVIEAYWLFNMPLTNIEVIIHPQSIIHSLVYYHDGSMLAQMGAPDMRIPIAYTLAWPERIMTNVKKLDLLEVAQLTFESVNPTRFPCLSLAYAALKAGGTASAILNAANEIAVAAFLANRIRFTSIQDVITEVLERLKVTPATSYEVILEADYLARSMAEELINKEAVV